MNDFKSLHHSFDVNLAQRHGVHEAIMIHHLQHWITVNKRLKRNFHDGRTWTYQTLEEIAAHFPYLSRDQVNRIIRNLCDDNVILKGNYNKNSYDRTVWYAFHDEERFIPENYPFQEEMAISPDRNVEIARPIPDTKTNTETKKKKETKAKIEKETGQSPLASEEAHDTEEFSNDVKEIFDMLLTAILSLRHKFKMTERDGENWCREIERMIRLDERDKEEIIRVIQWLPSDPFWSQNILCGKKLRMQFDKLCIKYQHQKADKSHYKRFAFKVKSVMNATSMQISDKGIFDPRKMNFELSFQMPYEDFCRSLATKYQVDDYEGDM